MTEQKRSVRVGRLHTVGHVVSELGKVYRLARRGEMDLADAKSLVYCLREIRCALEAGDLERRLDALETLGNTMEGNGRLSGRFGVQSPGSPAYRPGHASH